ncbi:pathogenesis-related protein 1A [Eucalyptus grandis]|uniref:pathogenesis-related protein 1A n=1 Tax=Eucalyptus grandis TaxID=71139 RepID=UPI00052742C1|nr:pathogenesis-related protein 1A [Eucalyptus grandis]
MRHVFVAAALLLVSIDVLVVSTDVPKQAVAASARMPGKGASLGGGMAVNLKSVGGTPRRPQGAKLGVPVPSAREFVEAHNKVRLGHGEPLLKWDKNLAKYSRRFASKRAADCKMIHSYGPYGENIFWGAKAEWSPSQVVDSWVSEKQFYDPTHNSCTPGEMCGHYTQVVWRDTARVGCAWIPCLNGGMYAICSYDPPGNYVNESPFVSTADQR